MGIESVNKNQNIKKQTGVLTTTEQNKIQKENTDQEIVAKASINITFNFVLKILTLERTPTFTNTLA